MKRLLGLLLAFGVVVISWPSYWALDTELKSYTWIIIAQSTWLRLLSSWPWAYEYTYKVPVNRAILATWDAQGATGSSKTSEVQWTTSQVISNFKEVSWDKKTLFFLKDSKWYVHQLFSSSLAWEIYSYYIKWNEVTIKWQPYYTSNKKYAWIFVHSIAKKQTPIPISSNGTTEKNNTENLTNIEKLIIYVYTEINWIESDLDPDIRGILKGNRLNDVIAEVRGLDQAGELDSNLYSFIKRSLEANNDDLCSLQAGQLIRSNIRKDIKEILDNLDSEAINMLLSWNNTLWTNKLSYLYSEIKNYPELIDYLDLDNTVRITEKNMSKDSINFFNENAEKLSLVYIDQTMEEKFSDLIKLSDGINALEPYLAWYNNLNSEDMIKYLFFKINYAALWKSKMCNFKDKMADNIDNVIANTDFELVKKQWLKTDLSSVYYNETTLWIPNNITSIKYDLDWESKIKIYYQEYFQPLAMHIDINTKWQDLSWCKSVWVLKVWWAIWIRYECQQAYDSITKEWNLFDKNLYVLESNWHKINIYFYSSPTVLVDIYKEILNHISFEFKK